MAKRKTWEDIDQAFKNDSRGYVLLITKSEFVSTNKTKLRYRCPIHPDSEQQISWGNYISGGGCPLCAAISRANKRRTDFAIIQKAFKDRGYILLTKKDEYINAQQKLNYICPKHSDKKLSISWQNFKNGHGCPYCAHEKNALQEKVPFEKIQEAFANDKRGYILLSTEEDYINNLSKLKYKCPNHPDKELFISWGNYIEGKGCKYCAREEVAAGQRKDFAEIKEVFEKDCRGFKLLSGPEDYVNNLSLLKYQCPNHPDKELYMSWADFKRGKSCPFCKPLSHGEIKIANWLLNNVSGFQYKKGEDIQKKFDDLKDENYLSYDFYLKQYNLLIEYQGGYHTGNLVKKGVQTQEQYEKQLKHDAMKRAYAEQHGINLLEIWENDYINIEEILERTIAEQKGAQE